MNQQMCLSDYLARNEIRYCMYILYIVAYKPNNDNDNNGNNTAVIIITIIMIKSSAPAVRSM